MRQMQLSEIPLSHRADPITSYEAAEKAVGRRAWWYWQVYQALRAKDCPEGNTPKSIASYVAAMNTMNYYEAYYFVQRVLSEMERRGWIFRNKNKRRNGCCVWWCYFGKESEVKNVNP